MKPTILLINFQDQQKLRKLKMALLPFKIRLKTVENQSTIEKIVRDDQYSELKTAEYLYTEGKNVIDKYSTSTVCLLKIINLVEINEKISRKTGDNVITQVCREIKQNLSPEYLFVRYMGPKFAIVFSGVDLEAVEEFMKIIYRRFYMVTDETVSFNVEKEKNEKTREILKEVYKALTEKGYNPINQIVGYILSGDPTYITSHNGARNLIRQVERDELLEEMVKNYIGLDK